MMKTWIKILPVLMVLFSACGGSGEEYTDRMAAEHEEDDGIPVESVREFEEALNQTDVEDEIHIYEGADHAFANPSGNRYNEEAAMDAWEKTMDFLDRTL